MAVSTAMAELSPTSEASEQCTALGVPGVDRLYRRLALAGVDVVHAGDAVSRTYIPVANGQRSDQYWTDLQNRSSNGNVHTAFADAVVPQCPLLSAEAATVVLPALGLQVPRGSAWVAMRVELTRFLAASGTLNENTLQRSLETCVDVGEELHDVLSWPTPDLRHDAWLNRRLGIAVTGFGDLLQRRRMDPADHDSLRYLNQLLLRIREILQSRSRAIARQMEALPAITLSDPSHGLPSGVVREDWRRRWRQAVQASLVRHRNLLVISPWSLFPVDTAAEYRYAELLPLLRHADACAFNKTLSIRHWNLKEFKRFHQRARAVLQQR
jgi:hypothetical protein